LVVFSKRKARLEAAAVCEKSTTRVIVARWMQGKQGLRREAYMEVRAPTKSAA